jgi:hypothetical protein
MPYLPAMRSITLPLWEARRPRLKKGLGVQPTLQSAGTNVTTASAAEQLARGARPRMGGPPKRANSGRTNTTKIRGNVPLNRTCELVEEWLFR